MLDTLPVFIVPNKASHPAVRAADRGAGLPFVGNVFLIEPLIP
jgi:hypothetical protein